MSDERPMRSTTPQQRTLQGEQRPPEGFNRKQRLMWVRHLADTGEWYSAIVQLADLVEEEELRRVR